MGQADVHTRYTCMGGVDEGARRDSFGLDAGDTIPLPIDELCTEKHWQRLCVYLRLTAPICACVSSPVAYTGSARPSID